jgi:hypothetical protein
MEAGIVRWGVMRVPGSARKRGIVRIRLVVIVRVKSVIRMVVERIHIQSVGRVMKIGVESLSMRGVFIRAGCASGATPAEVAEN